MKNLSLNKKLAGIAILLGFVALFLGNPYKGSHLNIDSKELSLIVGKEVDHVKVEELADWIIQGKSDFRIIDIRSEKEFNEYHIPGAENIPMATLEKADLLRNQKIILYSEGGIHSAQAWMLLRAKDYKGVYILFGGLEEWNDKILFPKIPENPTPEQKVEYAKTIEVSKYFGGVPQTSGTEVKETPKIQAPKLETPSTPTTPTSEPKKKKEGC
jgi:hypothetical protein